MTNKIKVRISYLFVFLISISIFLYYNRFDEKNTFFYEPQLICDNSFNETSKFSEGKKLYRIFCASCHKLDKKLIGPAIGGIKIDSISFFNYIVVKDTITNNYHKPNFKQLSIQNSNEILLYLKN